MKHLAIKYPILYAVLPVLLFSCKKFADVNTSPIAANSNQVQPEYFIDNAITTAQMNPDPSERCYILYWAAAGHQISDADGATFSWGSYNDDWTSHYYSNQASALTYINNAITIGNQQLAAGTGKSYTQNLIWVARIWRAYLLSEMSDGFGPMPINGFQGVNPSFSDVKTVYYYMLSELDSATAGINLNADAPAASEDPAYGYNWLYWQRYANSMRLRLAMRLSEVDPTKAQAEYEAAVATNNFIRDTLAAFRLQEVPGYNNLSGVYSRVYYLAPIAVTLNNLMVNLGGVTSASQLPNIVQEPTEQAAALANIKPANYIGEYLPAQLTTMTNNPYAPYYFDGMPATIDPRAYQIFFIPGNNASPTYPSTAHGSGVDSITQGTFLNPDGSPLKKFNAAFTWNAEMDGNWGSKGGVLNTLDSIQNIGITNGMVPSLQQKFRGSTAKRVFFGPWETYFLLAEGAVRGWATPISAQNAYDSGIISSFAYWNISQYVQSYLTNDDYNRVGTNVDWNNTTEATGFTASYVDGTTNTPGTKSINYPANNLYQGGAVRNDHLTKIITQKFIAQTPWLPLETWSDHRRLGLPFFENVVLESPINTLPALTSANVTTTSSQQFLPQRIIYPSSLKNSNVNGYNQAIGELGGADATLTPLWWAQH